MTTLRNWYLAGRWILLRRLAAVGAGAGIAAWTLALALHWVFGVAPPGVFELRFALLSGAFLGVVLALVLSAYWDRSPGRR